MRYKNNKITTSSLKSVSNSFFPKADGEGDYYMLYLNYFCLLKCNLLKKQVDVHIKSYKKCIEWFHRKFTAELRCPNNISSMGSMVKTNTIKVLKFTINLVWSNLLRMLDNNTVLEYEHLIWETVYLLVIFFLENTYEGERNFRKWHFWTFKH